MPDNEILKSNKRAEMDVALGDERREFLKKCGRFAVYVTPAMAIVLAHSNQVSANGGYTG